MLEIVPKIWSLSFEYSKSWNAFKSKEVICLYPGEKIFFASHCTRVRFSNFYAWFIVKKIYGICTNKINIVKTM